MGGTALKPIAVLGATGSIGRQTIEVADRIGVPIAAIAARTASQDLLEIALQFPDAIVCVVDPGDELDQFKRAVGDRVRFGASSVIEAAELSNVTVVNGIVGSAGLPASIAALAAGNRLALANKESLIAGGSLIREAVAEGGGELLPVDSEHSAIWQSIVGEPIDSVERLILTASGGPFRGWSVEEIENASVDQALAHPTWSMGPRITVDSATLMNKAFEVIEAHYLFDISYDQIDVLVHPQSIVHSFVEFSDGVVKAEVGFPDMRKPIQYALTSPDRTGTDHEPFSLAGHTLTFEEPDVAAFPCLELGYEAGRAGGTATAVLNAADEVAVGAFLEGAIAFGRIPSVVESVLDRHEAFSPDSVAQVLQVDREARTMAQEACKRWSR